MNHLTKYPNPVKGPEPDEKKDMAAELPMKYYQGRLTVTSRAFRYGESIPRRYTADGENINPPLEISHIPANAISLAVEVINADSAHGVWVHWLVWNIPVTSCIEENSIPGVEGLNDFLQHHYMGPCPRNGIHRYFFRVYALDTVLSLPAITREFQFEKEMSRHIIAYGEWMGAYQKTIDNHKAMKTLLFILVSFLAVTATLSGLWMMSNPDGGFMQLPASLLSGTPFSSFRLPGILMTCLIGGSNFLAVYYLLQSHRNRYRWVMYGAFITISWGILQVFMNQRVYWPEFLYAGVAVLILLLAWQLKGKWVV